MSLRASILVLQTPRLLYSQASLVSSAHGFRQEQYAVFLVLCNPLDGLRGGRVSVMNLVAGFITIEFACW